MEDSLSFLAMIVQLLFWDIPMKAASILIICLFSYKNYSKHTLWKFKKQ